MDPEDAPKPAQEEEGPLPAYSQAISVTEFEKSLPRLGVGLPDDSKSHGSAYNLIRRVLSSTKTTVVMTTLTVYALFADDLRLSMTAKAQDNGFFAGAVVCLAVFSVEIAAACWVTPSYRFSFNFWLDFLSTVSLIPDIGWIWTEMTGTSDSNPSSQINQIRNAGKMSRTGSRTSRIVRIVRLIRIIRLVKLYKSAKATLEKQQNAAKVSPDEEFTVPQESRIGKKLADLTTKRVIVIVLALLIILPLFELSFYIEPYTSWDCGTSELEASYGSSTFEIIRDTFIDYHKSDVRPLLFLSATTSDMSYVWQRGTNPSDLRIEEKYYSINGAYVAIFDVRYDTRLDAGLNIIRTIFVCIVLSLGAIYLTKDANTLVVVPIEKMVEKIKRIAKNPVGILEEHLLDVYDLEKKTELKPRWWQRICCIKMSQPKELETSVLENAILKIGTLLAISFGEAGARVIGENISKGDSINPMLDGKKVIAIFGFCDIRNFTDTTEVLQETVMTFVNEIAHIVHHTIDHHLGAANKNIGDAFMIVWKFKETLYQWNGADLDLLPDSQVVQNIADLSVISFLKILAKINRDVTVIKYRDHADLKKRIPNYCVRMGFSLHLGWAIEGAIGSDLKIDASYLSPNVNIVMKMEELTKVYGVPLLVSGALMSVCSPFLQSRCRHLDTVRTASGVVVRVYTYDVDLSNIGPNKLQKTRTMRAKEPTQKKHKAMQEKMGDSSFFAFQLFESSRTLRRLSQGVPLTFISEYNKAMKAYEAGSWSVTKELIESCLKVKSVDVPSQVILTFIADNDGKPPGDWSGSRPFPSK